MPSYDYFCVNEKCLYKFEMFLPMDRMLEPTIKSCPQCNKCDTIKMGVSAPGIADPVRLGVTRAPADFQKYVLGKIAAKHPGHNMYRRHDIVKEI